MQLGVGIPLMSDIDHQYTADTDPNFWQPLALSASVTQNGIPTPGGFQSFIGVQSLATTPFSLHARIPQALDRSLRRPLPPDSKRRRQPHRRRLQSRCPRRPPLFQQTQRPHRHRRLARLLRQQPPRRRHRHRTPPQSRHRPPYPANPVQTGDYVRVLAEFWADGPSSETPPGHWHVIANEVSDHPLTVKKIRGAGPTVNDLEWDIKTYFALSAATHDAACAAWALKRYYSGPRPITMIRYMAAKGQSSIPNVFLS